MREQQRENSFSRTPAFYRNCLKRFLHFNVLYLTLGVPTFKKNFILFGWVIDILNNFSWGFQKCKFYHRRTQPVDAQLLPTQPTYQLGYRLRGQSWRIEGVCLIKKILKGTFVRIKKLSFWESPVKIHDFVGTPNFTYVHTYRRMLDEKCARVWSLEWNYYPY